MPDATLDRLPTPNIRAIFQAKAVVGLSVIALGWIPTLGGVEVARAAEASLVGLLILLPNFVVALRKADPPPALLALCLAVDVIGITVAIHIAGGLELTGGPIGYVVVIGLAGIVLSERAAALTALGCAGAFTAMVWAEQQGVLAFRGTVIRSSDLRIANTAIVDVSLFAAAAVVMYAVRQVRSIYQIAEQLRRESVRALSHDLKNPLGAIQGYAEILGEAAPEERAEWARRVHGAAQDALSLVHNVLDAAALEGRPMTPNWSPTDLHRIIERVADLYGPAADRKDIRLSTATSGKPAIIDADAELLARALGNLVSNAIKYTPEGGTVSLEAGLDDDAAWLAVRDTGPGISAAEREQLFREFSRGKSGRGTEGTGLGLYIVRGITEAHGGTVHLESEVGAGSTFTMRLPIRSVEHQNS
jgi:signal transduction histidine kinase